MTDLSLQPILALLGHPVAGNPAQYMIEKALAHHGLDWRYLSLDVAPEDLGDAVRGMRAMGFRGGNCADPHKRAVLPLLDRAGPVAEMAGVVNCLVRDQSELVGENTEGKALLEALRQRVDPAGKRFVLLGAGQIARAVGIELALAGAEQITVLSRNEPAGRELAELLCDNLEVGASLVAWQGQYELPPETEVLVHATSIGRGDPEARVPILPESLASQMIVADVTLDPPHTWLVQEALQRGCKALDGLEVFLTQAAINFKLWTDVEPNPTVLREAVEEFLEL